MCIPTKLQDNSNIERRKEAAPTRDTHTDTHIPMAAPLTHSPPSPWSNAMMLGHGGGGGGGGGGGDMMMDEGETYTHIKSLDIKLLSRV